MVDFSREDIRDFEFATNSVLRGGVMQFWRNNSSVVNSEISNLINTQRFCIVSDYLLLVIPISDAIITTEGDDRLVISYERLSFR